MQNEHREKQNYITKRHKNTIMTKEINCLTKDTKNKCKRCKMSDHKEIENDDKTLNKITFLKISLKCK